MTMNICEECSELFNEKYKVINILGHGSFGTVFYTKRKIDEKELAVKRLDLEGYLKLSRAASEVDTISTIGSHPGYIFFEEIFWKEHKNGKSGHLYISMELCEKVTLKEWLKTNGRAENRRWNLMKSWMRQMAEALDHLHCNNFIHRDLKPSNIFFKRNSDFSTLKIGDFGLATRTISGLELKMPQLANFQNHTAGAGTPYYMAPEQSGRVYNEKVDIFALGLISGELIILDGPDRQGLCSNDIIRNGQWPQNWMDFPDALEFLMLLTQLDPQNRPSASQVATHPFIQ